ncbi:hypothetical protein NLJ89_g7882 [Agrocybe chaxingu]|uniref:Peptidase M43 pregnancy-associated plasma-A domain-containing protein n=1 Tax=Agrocybe chaxingu TaxID=84603 RepID=A0A9W8MRB5_9AGAR|nr:hypothetical protein NLJ89_g7882 [Agrocybe chaxingu]
MISFTSFGLGLLYGVTAVLSAQQRTCGTTISDLQILESQKHFSQHRRPQAAAVLRKVEPIDVYFHVIHRDRTLDGGFIPDAYINDQVRVLNEDYAPAGLSFNLKNVSRIENPTWFGWLGPYMETEMKRVNRQGGAAALNVYTVGFRSGSAAALLGYATFPYDYAANPLTDGIVMLYSSMPGGVTWPYNLGKTLTHETGHWLGLYHTFQGGCYGVGDQVDDTPAEASPAYGCPTGRDSCDEPGVDPIHNFMDYSDDSCLTEFTPGQITRLRDQIATYRKIVDAE